MLVAEDIQGNRRIATLEQKEELRALSNAKNLRCSNCGKRVIYHCGKKKIPHYNHEPHTDCTYNGEVETEEHLDGKLMIYNWLKNTYPTAQIELEYRILKTNQIADVYASFPNGPSFAFEIQCSIITTEKWRERSLLYKEANVIDFWLWGKKYYKEVAIKEDKETYKFRLKLRDLLVKINKRRKNSCFLNTETKEINQIGVFLGMKKSTDTFFDVNMSTYKINDMRIYHSKILGDLGVLSKYKQWCINRREQANELLCNRQKNRELDRKIKEENRQRRKEYDELKYSYTNFLNYFDLTSIMNNMTHNEKMLFQQLIKKYKFTNKNFPGIFKVFLEKSKYVVTPYPLWQLWIYDRFIFNNNNPKKNVWAKYIFLEFRNTFRIPFENRKKAAYLVKEYLFVLSKIKLLKCPRDGYEQPFKIFCKIAPIMNDFKKNSYIAYELSDLFNMDGLPTEQRISIINATEDYIRLVTSETASPAVIDIEFFNWLREAIAENTIDLSSGEKAFINELLERVNNNQVLTQVEYDTCHSIISGKTSSSYPF